MYASAPPSSRKRLFSLIEKSGSMTKFINGLLHSAKHARATPLILGANVLERNELISQLARRLCISQDDILVVKDPRPSFSREIRLKQNLRGVVFFHGDYLHEDLQLAYASQRLRHLRLFMPIVTKRAAELKLEGAWLPDFYRHCSSGHIFPSWEERCEDREDLMREMRKILPTHELQDAAEAYLRQYNGGTENVFNLWRNAVHVARRDANNEPVLQVKLTHLLDAEPVRPGVKLGHRQPDSSWPSVTLLSDPITVS
jgi:hypothetical protein